MPPPAALSASSSSPSSTRDAARTPSPFAATASDVERPQQAHTADQATLDSPERRRLRTAIDPAHPPQKLIDRALSSRMAQADLTDPTRGVHADLSKPPPAKLPPAHVSAIQPRRRRSSSLSHKNQAAALSIDPPASMLDLFAGRGLARRTSVSTSVEPQRRASDPGTPGVDEISTFEAMRPDGSALRASEVPFPILSSPAEWWSSLFGSSPTGEGKERKGQLDEQDQSAADQPPWERIKERYRSPKYPMVLCHGLFGFDTLGPENLPALQIAYWRGVKEALEAIGTEVLITSVPTSANIEERAKALVAAIENSPMRGREVNLIGHSMGGLDSRFLVSQLKPTTFTVKSVTTIATPHRGSPFADYMLDEVVGRQHLPKLLNLVNSVGIPGGGKAFDNLTTIKMARFNVDTPDNPSCRYYSYTASFSPSWLDIFRWPWKVIHDVEGPNGASLLMCRLTRADGLVSVASARWGKVQGNLEEVDHLSLVGWVRPHVFTPIRFRPASFFCSIAEMLAEEDL